LPPNEVEAEVLSPPSIMIVHMFDHGGNPVFARIVSWSVEIRNPATTSTVKAPDRDAATERRTREVHAAHLRQ
jgi:hypothetical protein